MPPGPTVPPPVLCRLCRRPIPRSAVKCPYCGARLSWTDRGEPLRMPFRWRVVAYASGLALLVVIAALWFWVAHDITSPTSSVERPAKSPRPTPAECADLIAELTRSPTVHGVTPELRDRLRLCLERR